MHPLEADFREWSKPPSATEEQRCTSAENVVRNALHHSPTGGMVRVAGDAEGSRLRLRIADQGPGAPPEALEKIFQPFYRGGKTSGGGYGLGLAIAERVIAAVDGRIRAKNADAGGLLVEIELRV